MKLYSHVVLIAALAIPAFCQKPSPFPEPDSSLKALTDHAAELARQAGKMAIDVKDLSDDRAIELEERAAEIAQRFDSEKIAELESKATALADKFYANPDFEQKLFQMSPADIADMKAAAMDMANQTNMAFLQAPMAPPAPVAPRAPKSFTMGSFKGMDDSYNAGTRALDEHRYEEAVQRFDAAIAKDTSHADGALYWKAYALNREGKRDDALAAITQLRRDYASSPWLHDAQALEAEVKQSSGQPVSPAQESNDDLKLLAINSLMHADAERAIPLVEGILKGNSGPSVKNNALFVISQNKSPRAQQVLIDYAKGGGNPDLQLRAIQYVGMSGTKEAQQQLAAIYASSSDTRVKSAVMQALMMAHASDALLNIAKTEKDPSLKGAAIRNLSVTRGVPAESLVDLYGSSDASAKREIVNGLQSRGDAKSLIDLARKESDPAMKKTIASRIGDMAHDNKDAMDYMMELLK